MSGNCFLAQDPHCLAKKKKKERKEKKARKKKGVSCFHGSCRLACTRHTDESLNTEHLQHKPGNNTLYLRVKIIQWYVAVFSCCLSTPFFFFSKISSTHRWPSLAHPLWCLSLALAQVLLWENTLVCLHLFFYWNLDWQLIWPLAADITSCSNTLRLLHCKHCFFSFSAYTKNWDGWYRLGQTWWGTSPVVTPEVLFGIVYGKLQCESINSLVVCLSITAVCKKKRNQKIW